MARALNIGVVRFSPWDPKKSLDFFINVLGFYPQLRGDLETSVYLLTNELGIDAKGRPDKIFVGCGDTLVEFCHPAPDAATIPQDPDAYVCGVVVGNLDEVLGSAKVSGAKVVRPIRDGNSIWGREVVIDVPGGPQISLREYQEKAGPIRDTPQSLHEGVTAKALNIGVVPYRPWDPDRSLDFLTNALGFSSRHEANAIFVGCADTFLEFHEAAPGAELVPQYANTYVCGVVVDDLDEVLAKTEALGAKVVRPTWAGYSFWGRQVVIDAPGGPQLSLREYRAPDGPQFDGWYEEQGTS